MKENIKLSEISKELPFKVPENYFQDFYSNLENKIKEEEKVNIKLVEPAKKSKIYYFKYAFNIAVAASLILAFLLFTPSTTDKNTQIGQNISVIIDEDYILGEMDDYSFYSALLNNTENEELSETEIVEYLASNVSDFEIYEELNK
jgi:hypothetical protein